MTRTPHFSPATSNHHFQPDGSSASHHHQHLSPQATLSPPRPNPVTSKSDPARHPESSNYASQSSSTHQRYHSRPDVFTELPSTDHLRRSYDMTQRDPEKAAQLFLPRHPEPTHSRKGRAGRDPEKQSYDTHNPSASMTSTAPLASPSHPSTISYTWEDLPQVPDTYEGHLARILMHLSFLSPLIALVLSLYSIATTILHIVLTPFSLCARRKPLSQQLIRTLSPVIRVQLRMIYSDKTEALTQIRAGRLALVAILSPFYAFWIAMSAWVAGFFWLYAAILGEPNVGEGKEMEGKAAVRGVRKWWENWLLFGIK